MEAGADRTIVIGTGNTIHRDDGAGVHALRRLLADPRLPDNVELVDGGTRGLELLADVHDCARLLLLDAIDVGEKPGTVIRMTADDLRGLPGGASVHQLGLGDLLATLPLISDAPTEVVLLGIQPAETEWGTELSPSVEASLGQLVDAAIEQLLLWSYDAAAGQDRPCRSAWVPCAATRLPSV
jgi:hydrogenase maturation protease